MSDLWEILVPTTFNCGKPIRTRQHKEWDRRVRKISKGLTVLKPVKGQWVNPKGKLFHERMIPVRILATWAQMRQIVNMTIDFYQQEAVLAYKISSDIILIHKEEK